MIYLDNAATSWPKPPCVVRAMADALTQCGANPGRAGHRLSLEAGRMVEGCREALADMLGESDASRVTFACNATDALNTAIHGALRTGDHAVATLLEHNSVLRPLSELSRSGAISLSLVAPDAQGRIHARDIEAAMLPRTRLVVMTHMSNVLGMAQDVRAVGEVCRRRGALLLVDCAQTAGHIPLEPRKWGCSMLALPGHKGLLGPHGTGALWTAAGVQLAPLRQGGTGSASESMFQPRMMPDSLESGTLNLPGIAGLLAGIEFVAPQRADIHRYEAGLNDRLRRQLTQIPGLRILGAENAPRVAITSVVPEGGDSAALADALDASGVAVRGGLHCAPAMHSYLGTMRSGAVRFAPGPFNTERDIDDTAALVARLMRQ